MSNGEAFLGVENSLRGRLWQSRIENEAMALEISGKLGLSDMLARVLAGRGIDADRADDFLNPSMRAFLPDPSKLRDMDKAAARIVKAITAGEPITIFGDYDVDGATSSALLRRFFAALGIGAGVYIPDRMREGYGPGIEAFEKLADAGTKLIITVDCGTSAHEPIARMAQRGVDVVVIDHHIAQECLPEAFALVNPNRDDDVSGFGSLAAVGVVFLLLVAINRILRGEGFFCASNPEPDLLQWLDLVALGTVCDVVPLKGLNRAFTAQGLKIMAARRNTGLAALADVARISGVFEAYHLGFILGPRINAAGRLGDSSLGTQLLSTDDARRAEEISQSLDILNTERKAVEDAVVNGAMAQAEKMLNDNPELCVLVVAHEDWHAGVIGIAAGRLKAHFNMPAIVIALDGEGGGKGSGRSIEGVDLGAAIAKAAGEQVILKGGGHKMAGGLSLKAEQLSGFITFIAGQLDDDVRAARLRNILKIDGAMTARGASAGLVAELEKAGPFGMGNPRPLLAFPAHHVVFADIVGKDHVRCTLKSGDGARLQAIAFRAAGCEWGQRLLNERQMPLNLAGTLKIDNWQGRSQVKLHIEDVALV